MLDEVVLEQRLAVLERTVADLQRRLAAIPISGNWLDQIVGSISDEEAFVQALEYGKAIRRADRPSDEGCPQP